MNIKGKLLIFLLILIALTGYATMQVPETEMGVDKDGNPVIMNEEEIHNATNEIIGRFEKIHEEAQERMVEEREAFDSRQEQELERIKRLRERENYAQMLEQKNTIIITPDEIDSQQRSNNRMMIAFLFSLVILFGAASAFLIQKYRKQHQI